MNKRRRLIKGCLLITAAAGILIAAGLAVWGLPAERFRPAVAAELSRLTGMRCSIAALKLSLRELRVEKVSFAQNTPGAEAFCSVGTLKIALDWNLLQALWQNRPLVIETLAAEDVFFHLDGLLAAIDAAAPSPNAAAASAVPSPAAALPAPAAGSSAAPVLQIMKFSLDNVRFRMHDVEIVIAAINGGRDAQGLNFAAAGIVDNGRITASGNLQLFDQDGLLQARQIEASLKIDRLPLPVFYRLFPDALNFLQRRGIASGSLDISYGWEGGQGLSFSGKVKTDDTIAYLFEQDVPVPASDWEFAGSYAADKLLIDKFVIQGETDDFHLDGFADFKEKRWVLKIASNGLSFPLLCHAAGNKHLADQMRGLVYFKGFVSDDNGLVEIKGNGGTQGLSPCFPPLNLTKSINGQSDFSYKSSDQVIRLDNIRFAYDFGKAAGTLHFPWLRDFDINNFACSLSVESELAPLSQLVGLELTGKVAGKVNIASANREEVKYSSELSGLEAVKAKFSHGEVLDIGKFNFALKGRSFWKNGRHILDSITVSSTPLQGKLHGEHDGGKTRLAYELMLEPRTLWPFWVHELKGKISAAMLGPLSLRGQSELSPERVLSFTNTDWRGELRRGGKLPSWYYACTGQGQITLNDAQSFSCDQGELKIHDGKNVLAAVSFKGSGARNPADSAPALAAGAVLRSRWETVAEICRLLSIPPVVPGLRGGALAVSLQTLHRENAPASYNLGVNLADARVNEVITPQQIAFQCAIEDRTRVDGELRLQNCGLFTADKSLNITGQGRVFSLENPQVELSLTSHSNIAKILQALNIKLPFTLNGMVTSQVNVSGTMEDPTLVIDGEAPDLVIDNGQRIRKLIKPRVSSELSLHLDRLTGAVSALKIKRGILNTADWRLQISAQSDRLELVSAQTPGAVPALHFGRGMACNYLFSGKRTLLPWLLPELSPLAAGAPDTPESLQSRGLVRAKAIPLAADGNYCQLRALQIENGLTKLDHLQAGKVALKNLAVPYHLTDGVFTATNGQGNCGGAFTFSTRVDFNQSLPQGWAELSASGLEIAKVLPGEIAASTQITAGRVFIPAKEDGKPLHLTFRGETLPEISASLQAEELSLRADGVEIQTVSRPIDWAEILKYDFHQSIAEEIARHLTEMSAKTAGQPQTVKIRQLALQGTLKDRCLTLNPGILSGENVADVRAAGRLFFDRRLQFRIWPTAHIERHFDSTSLAEQPTVKNVIATLPPEKKKEALQLLPDWLNQLAAARKLYLDVTGTVDAMKYDTQGIRSSIKSSLPDLTAKVIAILGQSPIMRELFGKDGLKIDGGESGKPLIDLDDLLK